MIETFPASRPSLAKAMSDEINHPSHYCSHPSGIECVTIAEHHNFCIGNVLKYIFRAGLKEQPDQKMPSQIKDLKKAQWYLAREIGRLEAPLFSAAAAPINPTPSPESPKSGSRCPGDEQPFP